MKALPRVLLGVSTLPFSAGEVLFYPKTGGVWVLNSTCAFIWHLLDLHYSSATAATIFSRFFNVPVATAEHSIESAVADFKQQGLLQGSCLPQRSLGSDLPQPPLAGTRCCCATWRIKREFIIGNTRVYLCSNDCEIITEIAQLLEPLTVVSQEVGDTSTTIAVMASVDEPGKWDLSVDGAVYCTDLNGCHLLPELLGLMYAPLFTHHHALMQFHAAVVVREGRALLLPAPSGSGKSTLVATLATMGWTFFSDELASVDAATCLVHSMLFPIAVKHGSVELLRQFYPDLGETTSWIRADSKEVRYICPALGSIPQKHSSQISTIIFPEFKAGGRTSCEPLSKFDALQYLAATESSTRPLCEADIQAMITIVENSACFRLGYSELAEAIDLIDAVFAA